MKTHKSDQKKHKCTDCDKTYKYFSDLIRHCRTKEHTYPERDQEKKSNKAILYEKCKVCKKDIDRTYMTSHIESSHGEKSKKIKCDKCDFVTNRMDSLYRHERQIHNLFNMKVDAISKTISSKGKICCYDCGKEFTNVEKAENHMLETNCKPNKCNKCEKVFSQRSNLLLHIRDVHEGNKSVCNKCGKKFKQKRNLTRHALKCNSKTYKDKTKDNIDINTIEQNIQKRRNRWSNDSLRVKSTGMKSLNNKILNYLRQNEDKDKDNEKHNTYVSLYPEEAQNENDSE